MRDALPKDQGENAEKLIEELERQNMENEKKELDNAKKAFEDKAERYLRKL